MTSLTQWLRESRLPRSLDDLDSVPKPTKPKLVSDTERRPERRRRFPSIDQLVADSYRFSSTQKEDPRLTTEQGWVMLVDHFREQRINLIFKLAQVSEDTRYRDIFDIHQEWKAHRRAVEKYCGFLIREHQVAIRPSRYYSERIYNQSAWTWFKTIRSIVRKRATKKGKALRTRANHSYYEKTVKPKRAKLSEEEMTATNAARRADYKSAQDEKIKGRIASAKYMLDLQKELDDISNGRVTFRGRDQEAMRRHSIESFTKQIAEIRKLLGKTLKRTLALIEGQ